MVVEGVVGRWTSDAEVVVDERLEEGGGNSFPFIYRGGDGDLEQLVDVGAKLLWGGSLPRLHGPTSVV